VRKKVIKKESAKDKFDIKNISDLPEKLVKELNKPTRFNLPLGEVITGLLQEKSPLNIMQILAAIYREHSKIYDRNYLQHVIFGLIKKGQLRKVGVGHFELA
jgi:hypothetical protein